MRRPEFRLATPSDVLPDVLRETGRQPGRQRCHAIGLYKGDCSQPHTVGSPYCYYHDKVATGLLDPDVVDVYPMWPLPKAGYVRLSEERDIA